MAASGNVTLKRGASKNTISQTGAQSDFSARRSKLVKLERGGEREERERILFLEIDANKETVCKFRILKLLVFILIAKVARLS